MGVRSEGGRESEDAISAGVGRGRRSEGDVGWMKREGTVGLWEGEEREARRRRE